MVTMREVNAFWRTEFGGRDMVDLTVAPFGKVPLASASVMRCGSAVVQPETGSPHSPAAAGISAW